MRHHNPKSISIYSRRYGKTCYSPYLDGHWRYKKPTPERSYIKVIKFVAEHPNCKRIDIIRGIWIPNADKKNSRGHQSALFACLLYDDYIDYNDRYEYTVTELGRDLLRKAGITKLTFEIPI